MAGPDWNLEREAAATGCGLVAGVDEAGRGPLAGPVVAAAVILPLGQDVAGVDDSKRLSHYRRVKAMDAILASAQAVGIGAASPGEIDRLNILQATLLAMKRAVLDMGQRPGFILIDGRQTIDLTQPQQAVVKGDARSCSIAAASILAKVTRDRMMTMWDRVFPGYGFARHKGYPTREHVDALARLGPCAVHRRSFGPVRDVLL